MNSGYSRTRDLGIGEAAPEPHGDGRPDVVDKTSSRVRVYTPSGMLDGSHHHPPGIRLSDMLRNQASTEKYMLLTDVEIRHLDGSTASAPFVLVNTQHTSVIVPLDDERPAG